MLTSPVIRTYRLQLQVALTECRTAIVTVGFAHQRATETLLGVVFQLHPVHYCILPALRLSCLQLPAVRRRACRSDRSVRMQLSQSLLNETRWLWIGPAQFMKKMKIALGCFPVCCLTTTARVTCAVHSLEYLDRTIIAATFITHLEGSLKDSTNRHSSRQAKQPTRAKDYINNVWRALGPPPPPSSARIAALTAASHVLPAPAAADGLRTSAAPIRAVLPASASSTGLLPSTTATSDVSDVAAPAVLAALASSVPPSPPMTLMRRPRALLTVGA